MATDYFKYDVYKAEWEGTLADPERAKVAYTWLDPGTLDAWRHERMRRPVGCIVRSDPDASWLTVGDGRFGTDAHYLLEAGAKNVHCTDISDALLAVGNQRKFIGPYSAENAECLSFADSSFDYVYCKESLHHFPRPYLALYEMFRVARRAVVLTEPRDKILDRAPLKFLVSIAEFLLRRPRHRHAFEESGNYLYGFSERELEKFMLGLFHETIASIGCNDVYIPGVEFVRMDSTRAEDKRMRTRLMRQVRVKDFLCGVGLMRPSLITAALFKEGPSAPLMQALEAGGWKVRKLPSNPYLGR